MMCSKVVRFGLIWIGCFLGQSQMSAQELTVPDSILSELTLDSLEIGTTRSVKIKVVYPTNYDLSKQYPVFLALSGGNQSEQIVDYCYAAWFRSAFFSDYITILPISPDKKGLRNMDSKWHKALIKGIQAKFNVSKLNWILAGTSNGGTAAFNALAANPRLFGVVITIPGALSEQKITGSWKHLKCYLLYGSEDYKGWIESVKASKKKLDGKVKLCKVIELKGQGHILPLDFDQDKEIYFPIMREKQME